MTAESLRGVAALCLVAALFTTGAEATCRRTCVDELRACRGGCGSGNASARRRCRQRCAEQSTCDAPGNRLRLGILVVNDCTTTAAGLTSFTQKLVVRRGNCDPVPIVELPTVGPSPDPIGVCRIYGDFRTGSGSVGVGLFQRVAVLPDASGIVFEVNNAHSLIPSLSPATIEPGIYVVRPDGSRLRRLGPPSSLPVLTAVADPSSPNGLSFRMVSGTVFGVSPSSRLVTFLDDVTEPGGRPARQVFTLDLVTGERRQITRLPPTADDGVETCCPTFVDDRTVVFFAGPAGTNARVHTDATGYEPIPVEAIPGSRLLPQFGVAGGHATKLRVLSLPDETPAKTYGSNATVSEVFILDGRRTLQLTNYAYPDTGFFTSGRGRVLLAASADPLGTNSTGTCQLFSIDQLGGHLRQLTSFHEEVATVNLGCGGGIPGARCAFSGGGSQDRQTGYVGFGSQCDPFGRNPYGEQYFSMRLDGSGLRQQTSFRGRELLPDGGVHVELGGPVAQAVVY